VCKYLNHSPFIALCFQEGETLIGSENAGYPQDIVLTGLGIEAEHCKIVLANGNATIYPIYPSQCWLNAKLIEDPSPICQGKRLHRC
jgi:kinesin family member 16B